jgi:GNAT superfamily N-acetyltransferase
VDNVTIRPASDPDVPAVSRIWHAGWLDGHTGHVPTELIAYRTPESFVPRTRDRVPSTSVAEVDGVVVGFVVVIGDEVEQVYVETQWRGTGVAGLLLCHAEEVVRAAGHDVAWLAVVAGNERARSFYARLGWADRGSFTYEAETTAGSVAVPCQRYEIDLRERVA